MEFQPPKSMSLPMFGIKQPVLSNTTTNAAKMVKENKNRNYYNHQTGGAAISTKNKRKKNVKLEDKCLSGARLSQKILPL